MSTKSIARARQLSPSQATSVARYQTPEERAFSSVQEPSTSSSSTSTVSAGVIRTTDKPSTKRLPPKIAQFQSPPELAHLADQPQTSTASRRPARPSREGTPEMTGFRGPSPIIQSNMSSFPLSHKRSTSTGSTASATMDSRNRIGLFHRQPSRNPSRNPSPNPSITSGSVISSRLPISGPTSESKVEKQRSQTLPTSTSAPKLRDSVSFLDVLKQTLLPHHQKQRKRLTVADQLRVQVTRVMADTLSERATEA